MGATYTRQKTYTDGDIIQASDTNDEFDQLLAAFASSTGHSHDGTTGEGGPITKLLGTGITIGDGTSNTDITVTFDGETTDGVLKWVGHDASGSNPDYFEFSDDILMANAEKLQFRDTAIYIQSSADGQLDLVADTELEITAPTVDINASTAVTVSNDLKLDSDAAVLGFGADNDVTLTHVADTGLLLNSTMALQFNDASQFINAPSATVLDINATDEIELNATLVDINGNVDISGTLTVAGALDFGDLDISNVGSIALDTITNDGTDITLDSSGDIILDAGGANVIIKDDGTSILDIANNSTDVELTVSTADKNFKIKGTDSSSAITALDIDMALAGKATFNGDVSVGAKLIMPDNTAHKLLIADGTSYEEKAVGDLSEISTVANDDVFIAVDTTDGGLKKITRSTIVSGLASSGAISNLVEDTTPQLGDNLDTNSFNIAFDDAHGIIDENGNEQIVFQTTSSAVNQIEVTNAASGSGVQIASTGGDTNIDLKLLPKGSGQVVIDGNVGIESGLIDLKNAGAVSKIKFYCESSNAHAQTLQGAPHSEAASNSLTLPSTGGNVDLVSTASTATLTNKTLTAPKIADGGFIADANGNELVVFQTTGSAVNEIEITNNATGSNPIIAATGGDTNIGIALTPKGTGEIVIGAGNLNYGGTAVAATGAELNIMDGNTSATSTTVADADRVVMNDNGTMVQVAVTDLAAYFDDEITAMPNLVTTGALNSGSITSGFGTIDTGSSTITTTGLISGGSLDIDNVLINGTTIGHTDDTDLITLADGALTVAGTLAATTGTFSGVLKTDDATEATSTTDGSLQTDGGLSVVKDAVFGDDVKLLSDASVVSFGANSEVTLTHVHDAGLALKHTATADDKPIILTLQTGETDMAANDVIGKLAFQAPDEGTGTDAILVAAAVQAVAEGNFAADNNATRLEFHTGASEAAAVKMTLSSIGAVKPVTYQETYASLSAASTVDCDLKTANHFAVTIDQNTTFTFTDPPASGTSFAFTLIITQHSTAATLTWPGGVDWAGGSQPAIAGNNEVQAYGFITRDGGTTYYGFLGGSAIG